MAKSTEGLALVGSDTLAGREIRDLMATGAPDMRLDLIAAEGEQAGVLTRLGDEPALTRSLDAAGLEDASVLILAGSPESSLKALELAAPGTLAIDLTFAAEERPDARLRAPSVEE